MRLSYVDWTMKEFSIIRARPQCRFLCPDLLLGNYQWFSPMKNRSWTWLSSEQVNTFWEDLKRMKTSLKIPVWCNPTMTRVRSKGRLQSSTLMTCSTSRKGLLLGFISVKMTKVNTKIWGKTFPQVLESFKQQKKDNDIQINEPLYDFSVILLFL